MKYYLGAIFKVLFIVGILWVADHYAGSFRAKQVDAETLLSDSVATLETEVSDLQAKINSLEFQRPAVETYLASWSPYVDRSVSRFDEGVESWAEQRGIIVTDRTEKDLSSFYYLGERISARSISKKFVSEDFSRLFALLRFIESEFPLARLESMTFEHKDGPLEMTVSVVMTELTKPTTATAL